MDKITTPWEEYERLKDVTTLPSGLVRSKDGVIYRLVGVSAYNEDGYSDEDGQEIYEAYAYPEPMLSCSHDWSTVFNDSGKLPKPTAFQNLYGLFKLFLRR